MEVESQSQTTNVIPVHRKRVVRVEPKEEGTTCTLSEGGPILVTNQLGAHIRPGDEIEFYFPLASEARAEIYVHKKSASPRTGGVYHTLIGYAAQPKTDKRDRFYVLAEVSHGRLEISTLHFPCEVLRDYFYVADRSLPWDKQMSLYDLLRIPRRASPAELRLAYRVRELELRAAGAPRRHVNALERAFNVLAEPKLRACYDTLLSASSPVPVLFPLAGFGTILVSGEQSGDGQTFFVSRILSFTPEHRRRSFHASLRRFDFYSDRAIYRDPRRKLELMVDPALIPLVWDATWNQWKHLLGAKVEITAMFVESGNYRHRGAASQLVKWETALPSRVEVKLPADIVEQIETARKTYHRFGQFSDALARIRERVEREPVEREELRRLSWGLGVPGDFDIAQINWRPDYDAFFYRQLCRRARRLYLFRSEYIFDLEGKVVVETPQIGHATYLFSKPRTMEEFLAVYVRCTREDIRQNRGNVAERLGFMGRVVHGSNPKIWLRRLKQRLGGAADCAEVASD